MKRVVLQLLLTVLTVTAVAAEGPERLLVGLVINGHEVATVEVYRDAEGYLLPIRELLPAIGAREDAATSPPRLLTPLGTLLLGPAAITTIDGRRYLRQRYLEDRLGIRLHFDEAEFALGLDLPWRPGAVARGPQGAPPTPDFRPPAFALSTLREDASFQRRNGADTSLSSTTVGGPLAGGSWRARVDADFKGTVDYREYAWYRRHHRALFLLGYQRLQLHPVLDSFELTGAQAAWTNQPLEIYPTRFEARELLPRQLQAVSTFRGPGPVGAIAQLRIDGQVVAQQTIGLNGRYEFLEVPLRSRQLSRVEVLIFDRANPAVPLSVREETVQASAYLLRRGAVVHLGGAGAEGDLTEEDPGSPRRFVGFYQVRYGAGENLTLEAAAQETGGNPQLAAGAVTRLGPGVVASAALGAGNGLVAYDASLSALRPPWKLYARSQSFPRSYPTDARVRRADHFLELGYQPSPALDFALIGRQWIQAPLEATFVRPALTWRPSRRLSLFARPDQVGDYRLDLRLQADRRTSVSASYQHGFTVDVARHLSHRTTLSVSSRFSGDLATRHSVLVSRSGSRPSSPWWALGVVGGPGSVGALASLNWRILPGVLARVEYEGLTVSGFASERRGSRLLIGITTDFTVTRRGLLPANSFDLAGRSGAVAGRIQVVGGRQGRALEGILLMADGTPAGRTEAGGVFFVGRLSEGLHRIDLDLEGLPIELAPVRTSAVVEVSAGTVTSVELAVRPEYGIAGRVTDAEGRPLERLNVELLGEDGHVVAKVATDRFGLYRMDGIPPGVYTLRLERGSLPLGVRPARRAVEVIDRFLFDQDLQVGDVGPPGAGGEPPGPVPSQ